LTQLYVHWWDFSTSIEEVMTSLNQLVLSGKVLYLGISDTPAWVVTKANQCKPSLSQRPHKDSIKDPLTTPDARDHGLRPFSVYQGKWNAAERDFERDIIPMAASEGMGLAPWASLGGGNFKSSTQWEEISQSGNNPGRGTAATKRDIAVSKVLESVAQRHGTVITSVALAYVLRKAPYVSPIIGGRKVEHLESNIQALGLELSDEDVKEIEGAYEFDVGFPMNFLFRGETKEAHPANSQFLNSIAKFDYPDLVRAVKPKELDA
jgi:aryl-alcohol dehydrogenase-like predicted oxidoreductase